MAESGSGYETRSTYFTYELNQAKISLLNKTVGTGVNNYFALLTEIKYPTHGRSLYDYSKYVKNAGTEGYMEFFKVDERYESLGDVTKYNYRTLNYRYDGTGEYDGYPNYYNESSIPGNYQFKTQILDDDNNSEIYTYNKQRLNINLLREGTEHKREIINDYDLEKKLLTKTIKKEYNKNTGNYQKIVENFQWNDYRDLMGYWDPRAARDAGDEPLNDEHKTSYEYHNLYHFITAKIYKKDNTTTISEQYIPTADDKAVEWARIYENDILKSQTWYAYDLYGNIIEERRYLEDWSTYIVTKYSYDNNVLGRDGQFSGAYLTKKWIEGVKDVDGNYVEATE